MLNLFPNYAETILALNDNEFTFRHSLSPCLMMARETRASGDIVVSYAPFDYCNSDAKIVIVGITPGHQQMVNALSEARRLLKSGANNEKSAETAKSFASFSGTMRTNLIAMLDHIGVNRKLGITSTASLWTTDTRLVHFTSALRYPVFVNGEDYRGTPDILKSPMLRQFLENYTGQELRRLSDAILVPLWPVATNALTHLARISMIDSTKLLDGLPHPSGANAERIAYFLGRKAKEDLSLKTNADSLDVALSSLRSRVAEFCC
ncbi:MAG: hypothetical protein QM698_05800 [Micropepsaceae bacterium]